MADLRIDDLLKKRNLDIEDYAKIRELTGGVDGGQGVNGAQNDFWGNNPTATIWNASEFGRDPSTSSNSGVKNSYDNSMGMAGSSVGTTPDPMSMGGSIFTADAGDGVNPSPTVAAAAPVAVAGAPVATPGALQTPGGSDGHPQGQGQNPTSDNNQPRFGASNLFESTGGGLTPSTTGTRAGAAPQQLPTLPPANGGTQPPKAEEAKEPETTGAGTLSTGDNTGDVGDKGTIGTGDSASVDAGNADTGLAGTGDGTTPTGTEEANPNDSSNPDNNNEDPTGGEDSAEADTSTEINQQEQQKLEQLKLQKEQERLAQQMLEEQEQG